MRLLVAAALLISRGAVADEPFAPLQGDRWAVGAQLTVIVQGHPAFPAAYSGPNSLGPTPESATSVTGTLFLAATPWPGGFVVLAPEVGLGNGVSGVVGAGAFPNADIVRVPSLPPEPYIARAFLQQTLLLRPAPAGPAGPAEPADGDPDEGRFAAGPGHLNAPSEGSVYAQLTFGKLGINDLFDLSEASNDPRHRFLNWALVNQGAWDYCADVRGYSWVLAAAVSSPWVSARAAGCLMPTAPNGPSLDTNLAEDRSEVAEVEVRPLPGLSVSLLGYLNHANAGSYREALAGTPMADTRRPGALKKGASLHLEQRLGWLLLFARAGWNDGQTETFAYSEIDRSLSAGATFAGARWGRPRDSAGLGLEVGGLSADHAAFLAAGGRGFLLGDGALRYGPEEVVEAWYSLSVIRGVQLSLDAQLLAHPGFNRDRGPVPLLAARVHFHL